MSLLFVYGTLKRGGTNHRFLAGQEFRGEAQTRPGYALYDLAGYPGMVEEASGHESVVGEVWSVDDACLGRLDDLEGTDEGLYRRATVPLDPPHSGEAVEAYLYMRGVEGRPRVGSSWFV
jgi:gamma-glutamylcyclotransferase (GGCT)/AIG2-like uncharacterized protein YtfP